MAKQFVNGLKPTIGCINSYTINENAYIISDFQINYSETIHKGIHTVIKENQANLIHFTGSALKNPLGYNYQLNNIYKQINKNDLDGIIIITGTICNFMNKKELESYFAQFKPLPIVSVGVQMNGYYNILIDNKIGMKAEVKHLIDHHHCKKIAFIRGPENNQEAEERYAAYLEALTESGIPVDEDLIAQGFFYQSSGIDAICELLDKRKVKFDALVSANDDMAIAVIHELSKRGINVPLEVRAAGFDDIEEAKYFEPPLTTVKQPLIEIGMRAAELILKAVNGVKIPRKLVVPTVMVIRSSCGCFSEPVQLTDENNVAVSRQETKDYFGKMLDSLVHSIDDKIESGQIKMWFSELSKIILLPISIENLEDLFMKLFFEIIKKSQKMNFDFIFWHNFLTLLNQSAIEEINVPWLIRDISKLFHKARIMAFEISRNQSPTLQLNYNYNRLSFIIRRISSVLEINDLMAILSKDLPEIGIKSCFLIVYQKEIILTKQSEFISPAKAEILLAFKNNLPISISREQKYFNPQSLLPKWLLKLIDNEILIAQSLFVRERLIGFILMEIPEGYSFDIEILRQQISNTILSCLLFQERNDYENKLVTTMNELETSNKKLEYLSINDEMTGLYNRRGFLSIAANELNLAHRLKTNGTIFFIDLDGLKLINDTFGHQEGDFAIIESAEILRESFRNIDVIGRLGGDEFVVLAINIPNNFVEDIIQRILINVSRHNLKLKKGYQISMSVGNAYFNSEDNWTIDKIMAEADRILYQQKKDKKRK
jgi:diguanylate cyclase (GGDEF)-like protein